jgi:hypothetical protein
VSGPIDPRVLWMGKPHPTGGYDRAFRTEWAEQYMLGDVLHRVDGPARVWCDGSVEYWRLGVRTADREAAGSRADTRVQALRAALERQERALVVRQAELQRELASVRARIAGLPR